MRCWPLALLVFVPATARAERTVFGWLYDTDVLPERGVALDGRVEERDVEFKSLGDRQTIFWLAPVVGVTDHLELALPVEAQWNSEDNPQPGFVAAAVVPRRYGAELRYRFVAQDAASPPAFAPLLRVAVKRDVTGAIRPEADAVLSLHHDRIHAVVDAGVVADLSTNNAFSAANGSRHVEFHPGLGISVRTVGELRFGAELYGELALDAAESGHSWAIVAPNVAWTHGRLWAAAAYGIGIYGMQSAPRLVWGMAL